jgi:hypothetical protein
MQPCREIGEDVMSGSLDWSIRIVSVAGGAAFESRVPNATPGVLQAQIGDIVTWGNATSDTHQPWPTEGNQPATGPATTPDPVLFFSDPIAANASSNPQFVVPLALTTPPTTLKAGSVIYYCCKNHPNAPTERGQIVIF